MRKVIYIFFICISIFLVSCGANDMDNTKVDDNVIAKFSICPNENTAKDEKDKVFYNIVVSQVNGEVLVVANSNSEFFKDLSYSFKSDDVINSDDISVRWLTLMGSENVSDKDQASKAEVTINYDDKVINQRVINFVGGSIENILDNIN